jgi:hypothetical protein
LPVEALHLRQQDLDKDLRLFLDTEHVLLLKAAGRTSIRIAENKIANICSR